MIGHLFRGKVQYHEESWEPFSNTAMDVEEDYQAGDWAEIITRAKEMGVQVKFTTSGIKMVHQQSGSKGLFQDYKGGIKMAHQFLDEIA